MREDDVVGLINKYEVYYSIDTEEEEIPKSGKLVVQANDESSAMEFAIDIIQDAWSVSSQDIDIRDVLFCDEIYIESYNID